MKEKDTILPPDDKDLNLAKRLGEQLDVSSPVPPPREKGTDDSTTDPLYRALLEYKKNEENDLRTLPSAETTQRAWKHIESDIQLKEAGMLETPHRLRLIDRKPRRKDRSSPQVIFSSRTWVALAASFFILIGFGWLFWNQPVHEPVLVASAETQIFSYTAPDGSSVLLRPHSRLYLLSVEDRSVQYQLEGEGYFSVARDESRTFSVEAGDGNISVLGTQFNISTWGDQAVVYLEEGRVRCEHQTTRQVVVLDPGQRCEITSNEIYTHHNSVASDEYTDWLNQEMMFELRPIHRVLAELGHHYELTFVVPAEMMNQTLSGRILLGQRDQTLLDLGLVMGGRFEEDTLGTYRFSPE